MKPSDHPHLKHLTASGSPFLMRLVRAASESLDPDFVTHPRSRADGSSTRTRHPARPNQVHLRLGLVFRLGLLSTRSRGRAVTLDYSEVAHLFRTQTFTGWFHGFISARRATASVADFEPGGAPSLQW
jgi:hypothetical protein